MNPFDEKGVDDAKLSSQTSVRGVLILPQAPLQNNTGLCSGT
jgi:hypothetical protein